MMISSPGSGSGGSGGSD